MAASVAPPPGLPVLGSVAALATLLEARGLTLLCFGDPWVSALSATLRGIAERFPTVTVAFVDLESEAARHAGVSQEDAPITVVLRDGVEIGRLAGLSSVSRLELALESALHAPDGVEALRAGGGVPISW